MTPIGEPVYGPWIEQLEAIAAGREVIAVAGVRELPGGVGPTGVHVAPVSVLDGKGEGWSLPATAAVRALCFVGDELLLAGDDDGVVTAWDVTGKAKLATLGIGASVRALAMSPRGDVLAAATADGALHFIGFAIIDARPRLGPARRLALSDGAIHAVAWDASGLCVAGGADGQLAIVVPVQRSAPETGKDNVRKVSPGGDGGIRALACIGDGRVAVGCGDGSLRLCFLVGDVEATDRAGDHGHQAALRAIALGPVVLDDAGRDQPRRAFTCGDDRALKCWFVDGNRRPKSPDPVGGPIAALAVQLVPVAAEGRSLGRLWLAAGRTVCAYLLGADADPTDQQWTIQDAFARWRAQLSDAKVAVKVKLAAIAALTPLAEDAARELLDLAVGQPGEVAIAALKAIAESQRRASRPVVRGALGRNEPEVRAAAYNALVALEPDQPLAALRVALRATAEDVRALAVDALVPLARTSVLAAGMISDTLRDNHVTVRARAFAALRRASTDTDAIRTALAHGTPDIRAEALVVLGFATKLADAPARALASSALDDDDAGVRNAALACAVAQRPALAARLYAAQPDVKQAFDAVAKRMSRALALPPDTGEELSDDDREPLFAALACRHADTAIRGAGALVALRDPRAAGAMLQLTREPDAGLRRNATHHLIAAVAVWPDDDRLAARLAWLLDDGDAIVRSIAFDALAKLATTTDAELDLAELALRTSQEDIRVRALQILVKAGAASLPAGRSESGPLHFGRADALLGDALDDEAAAVRGEAFRTLWAWHAGEPLVPIERGGRSRHADLRLQVVAEIDKRKRAKQATAEMERVLVRLLGDAVAQVGLAALAALARDDDGGDTRVLAADTYLAGLASPVAAVRAAAAVAARRCGTATPALRTRLVQLVGDDHAIVHLAAIETLDALAPGDAEGFALALGAMFYELRVRAAELCAARRDPRAVAAMEKLLAIAKTDVNRPSDGMRQRAAEALADAGDPGALAFLHGLVEDDDPIVREMGARGVAAAARPDHPGSLAALVALLGHADLPVRSWGGEGLARLGDLRALPVLAGTQQHDHRPLRIGAIVGFVALGADGVRGLRQGLEDRDREIQDLAFAVIVARDLALAQAGIAPDLLVDAMSSPSPEIRFAAARVLERRAAGDPLDAAAVGELVGPRTPEKAADAKDWPPINRRAAILQVVADAIASDESTRRYAATQVLALRPQPVAFWREAARLVGPAPRAGTAPHMGGEREARTARRAGWLRRLVTRRDVEETALETAARAFVRAGAEAPGERAPAVRLVFGVYAGLVRQAPAGGAADDTHRVRRDAVGRLVELASDDAVGVEVVMPVLAHAIGDPHHLVRQAAMSGLRSLYPPGALAPLALAITGAADLGKAALDELVELAQAGDDRATALVTSALDSDDRDVRTHAADRLARLYPAGSVAPQLVAARSRHGDVRLAAVAQLAAAPELTTEIRDAMIAALSSEHDDLRLQAAVALARRGEPTGIEVLGAFLRSENSWYEAMDALVSLGGPRGSAAGAAAAAEAIAARLDDDPDKTADRSELVPALGRLGDPAGAPVLVRRLVAVAPGQDGDVEGEVDTVLTSLDAILAARRTTARGVAERLPARQLADGRTRARYDEPRALATFAELASSPLVGVRLAVATRLGAVDDRGAEDVLARLLGDRDATVRTAAAEALALRVEHVASATLSALDAALRGGRRELVLAAAIGLAARKRPEAFQALMLVAKAGEPAEQERAVVWLGALGDVRALPLLRALLEPAPDASEAERALQPAAAEALARMLPALAARTDDAAAASHGPAGARSDASGAERRAVSIDEANDLRDRIERIARSGAVAPRLRALTGLRVAGDPRSVAVVEEVAADAEARGEVRVHAIAQLGLAASPTPRSEALLAELLSYNDDEIREAAQHALERVVQGDRTRLSLYGLASPFDEIAEPAAAYLASAGDAATLVARLGNIKSADVRRMLREGVVRRGELPVDALAAALAADDVGARIEAAWIAGNAGARANQLAGAAAAAAAAGPTRWGAAKREAGAGERAALEGEAWRAALWAARRIGADGVDTAATSALGASLAPAAVRRVAAEVLATGTGSGAALAAAVGDPERAVRAVAARAVAAAPGAVASVAAAAVRGVGARADATTIGPLAKLAWPAVRGELIGGDATRGWAVAVAVAEQLAAGLVAIARDRKADKPARIAAIAGLGRIGGDDARRALEAVHGDDGDDDDVKLAAWKALRRIARAEARAAKDAARQGDKRKRDEAGAAADDGGGEDDDGGGEDDDGGDEDDDQASDDDDGGGDDDGGDDEDEDDDE